MRARSTTCIILAIATQTLTAGDRVLRRSNASRLIVLYLGRNFSPRRKYKLVCAHFVAVVCASDNGRNFLSSVFPFSIGAPDYFTCFQPAMSRLKKGPPSVIRSHLISLYLIGDKNTADRTEGGRSRKMASRLSYRHACDLGFGGSLNDWERLIGALPIGNANF